MCRQARDRVNQQEWVRDERSLSMIGKRAYCENERQRQEVNIKTEQELRNKEWRLNTKTEIESQKC